MGSTVRCSDQIRKEPVVTQNINEVLKDYIRISVRIDVWQPFKQHKMFKKKEVRRFPKWFSNMNVFLVFASCVESSDTWIKSVRNPMRLIRKIQSL